MPQPLDVWSSLFTLPALIATLVAGLIVAVFTFILNRIGARVDQRTKPTKDQPSRRNIRAGRRYLTKLATRPRRFEGPPRWTLTFNSSLGAYEVEQHGPDDVHDLRIDFFDTRVARQAQLTPTVRVRQLPPEVPLTMSLGAPTRVQHYGLALRWDDGFGADQFEKLRVKDAFQD